jgi:hypothetical protein
LVAGIAAHEQAQRVDDMLQAVTGPPGPDSAVLALATLTSIADRLHELISLPKGAGMQALYALTRRFHGHALADELRLPRGAAADALLTPGIHAIRRHRAVLRGNPTAWNREHDKNIQGARALFEEAAEVTEYEGHAEPATALT